MQHAPQRVTPSPPVPPLPRVLLLQENDATGGVNAMIEELQYGLRSLGWNHLQVETLSHTSPWALMRAAWRCDVIVATNNFRTAYVGWALGQVLGRHCLVWVHGPLQEVLAQSPASNTKQAALRKLYRRIPSYVFNSAHTRHSFESFTGRLSSSTQAWVIPNAVRQNQWAATCHDRTSAQVVELGYVGRLAREKSPQRLIAMLRLLPAQFRLTLVGDGPERIALQAASADLQAAGRLSFAGEKPRGAAIDTAWHMTVLASQYEGGCPLSALESAAAGIPFVAPPLPALQETVNGAAACLLAGDDTPETMAQAVLRVHGLTPESIRLALDAVLSKHRPERFARQWHDVLLQVGHR